MAEASKEGLGSEWVVVPMMIMMMMMIQKLKTTDWRTLVWATFYNSCKISLRTS